MSEITVDELAEVLDRGVPLIDVRERDEYTAGHVPGAVLMPMGEVMARVGEVPRGEPVYVICQSGARSARAAQWYRTQGIDAYNIAGGTAAWVQQGNEVVEGLDP